VVRHREGELACEKRENSMHVQGKNGVRPVPAFRFSPAAVFLPYAFPGNLTLANNARDAAPGDARAAAAPAAAAKNLV
jgi:hypothetical protein